jgi:hypothetical protein
VCWVIGTYEEISGMLNFDNDLSKAILDWVWYLLA